MITVIADEQICEGDRLKHAGIHLMTMSADEIKPEILNAADALIVRSVTPVDEKLLWDSKVRFVGSVTAGTDHIDQDYLSQKKIAFAHAPGANKTAVAEYVLTALLYHHQKRGISLDKARVGIIGFGNIGSALAQKLSVLEIPFQIYDPFKGYDDLNAVLSCDVLSIHTPLTDHPSHPTRNLIDADQLSRLSSSTVLINTARGGIVHEAALKQSKLKKWVLDVWENEPKIDQDLLRQAIIASPHVAGYSAKGRSGGTTMVQSALHAFFDLPLQPSESALPQKTIPLSSKQIQQPFFDWLAEIALSVYNPEKDTQNLKSGQDFLMLRKQYLHRLEWSECRIEASELNPIDRKRLEGLGFQVSESMGNKKIVSGLGLG